MLTTGHLTVEQLNSCVLGRFCSCCCCCCCCHSRRHSQRSAGPIKLIMRLYRISYFAGKTTRRNRNDAICSYIYSSIRCCHPFMLPFAICHMWHTDRQTDRHSWSTCFGIYLFWLWHKLTRHSQSLESPGGNLSWGALFRVLVKFRLHIAAATVSRIWNLYLYMYLYL